MSICIKICSTGNRFQYIRTRSCTRMPILPTLCIIGKLYSKNEDFLKSNLLCFDLVWLYLFTVFFRIIYFCFNLIWWQPVLNFCVWKATVLNFAHTNVFHTKTHRISEFQKTSCGWCHFKISKIYYLYQSVINFQLINLSVHFGFRTKVIVSILFQGWCWNRRWLYLPSGFGQVSPTRVHAEAFGQDPENGQTAHD